jgi:muconolactone delta-isomerase
MRVSQTFREDINSNSDKLLTISLFDIDENTKLEDILNKVENIYFTHFPD